VQIGAGHRGRGVGEVPDGVEAAVARGLPSVVQPPDLEVERRVVGRIGVRQVRPHRHDLGGSVRDGLGDGVEQIGPVPGLRAVAGEPGVDLEMQPGRALRLPRSGQHRGEMGAGGHREVDVRADGRGELVVGKVQPGQERSGDARGAQIQRLLDRADTQPRRARCQRGLGDRNGAVAVAVGLDHRHEGGGGCGGPQHADVVPDGGEIDERLGAGSLHTGIFSSAPDTMRASGYKADSCGDWRRARLARDPQTSGGRPRST
jgi:hypothetical protein